MKRKNLLAALCTGLSCLMLTGCSLPFMQKEPEQPAAYVPKAAELVPSGSIDWNDIPRIWSGTGGSASGYFEQGVYYPLTGEYPYDNTYEDLSDGDINISVTRATVRDLKNSRLMDQINARFASAYPDPTADKSFFDENFTEEMSKLSYATLTRSIYPEVDFAGNVISTVITKYEEVFAYDDDTGVYRSAYNDEFEYAVYDGISGAKLTLSDLFATGTDLNEVLNPLIAKQLESAAYDGLKRPFRGLPANYPHFLLRESELSIRLPRDNPYTRYTTYLSIPISDIAPYMAQPRANVAEIVNNAETSPMFRSSSDIILTCDREESELHIAGVEGNSECLKYLMRDKKGRESVDKINRQLTELYAEAEALDLPQDFADTMEEYYDGYTYSYSDLDYRLNTVRCFMLINCSYSKDRDYSDYASLTSYLCRNYDLRTGELISLGDIARDKDALLKHINSQTDFELDDLDNVYNFTLFTPSAIVVYRDNSLSADSIEVAGDYLNIDYFQ